MPDQKTEFEIGLKDSITPQLKEIAKQLRELNRAAKEVGETGSKSVERVRESHIHLAESSKEALKHFKEMGETILDFGKELLGVGGIMESIHQVAEGINEFAKSGVALSNFSRDTRFTIEDIHEMRGAMARMGITADQADTYIGHISLRLQQLQAFKEASPLFQDLEKTGQYGAMLGRQLLGDVKTNQYKKAWEDIVQFYKSQGPEMQFYLSQALGVPQSVLDQYDHYAAMVKKGFDGNEAAMKQYVANLAEFRERSEGEWNRFYDHALADVIKWMDEIDKHSGGHALSDWAIGEWDKIVRDIRATFDEGLNITVEPGSPIDKMMKFWANKPDEATMNLLDAAGKKALGQEIPDEEAKAIQKDKEQRHEANTKLLNEISSILKQPLIGDGQGGIGGGGGGGLKAGLGGFRPGVHGGGFGPTSGVDETGNPIDQKTMSDMEDLAKKGDVDGMQRMLTARGYRASGLYCGIFASKYVRAAGFKPPPGSAIATSWHNWGVGIKAADINAPEHPLGSMVATYFHRRYGGGSELLPTGATGGHVMTIVPGSYDPKTNMATFLDQSGAHRRSLNDLDLRYAGVEAVREHLRQLHDAIQHDETKSTEQQPENASPVSKDRLKQMLDKIRGTKTSDDDIRIKTPDQARQSIDDAAKKSQERDGADIKFHFNNVPPGVKTHADAKEGFDHLEVNRSKAQQFEHDLSRLSAH